MNQPHGFLGGVLLALVLSLVAGALLLTPGFVTDALGGLLFVPPLRDFLRRTIGRHLQAAAETRIYRDGEEVYRSRRGSDIFDGDYEDVTDRGDSRDDDHPRLPK